MDNLQINQTLKSLSRSQSPAQTDFTKSDPSATDDSVIRSRMQTTGLSHQDSSSSRLFHHAKSHSRDLGSSPLNALGGSVNVSSARNIDDSPQKQLLVSGDYQSSMYSPNVSYAFSSTDEYGSPLQGNKDDADGGAGTATSTRVSNAIAHLEAKIVKVKDLIRLEQTIRDDNVNEYLKLAANADKQQLQRIKAVFEKKNQKSAHCIAQLQKKLEGYQKRIKNWETYGSSTGQGSHRPPREVLRDMGQGLKNVGGNIKDGITGLGGSVMAAPREIAHYFIRSNRFGSADNISQLAGSRSGAQEACSGVGGGGSGGAGGETPAKGNTLPRAGKITSDEGSECSSVTSESIPGQGGSNNLSESAYPLKPILSELRERREDYERLCEKIDSFKNLAQEISYLSSALQEERFKSERLEEQINDLTELHQNEVENLKQALADVEEKVQYQSEERLRDIHEALDLCQTKISKLEHGAAQVAAAAGVDTGGAGIAYSSASPAPRLIAVKLINVLLTLLQLILLLVATVAGIIMPFLTTRVRILTTSFAIFVSVVIMKQWPEVMELSAHMVERLKKNLIDEDGVR